MSSDRNMADMGDPLDAGMLGRLIDEGKKHVYALGGRAGEELLPAGGVLLVNRLYADGFLHLDSGRRCSVFGAWGMEEGRASAEELGEGR